MGGAVAAVVGTLVWPALAAAQLAEGPPRASGEEIETLAERYQRDPASEAAALAYARALASQDRLSARRRAAQVLKRAVRRHPESVELRLALGDLYYRQGYFTLARGQYRRVLELGDDVAPAYSRLGRLALRDWLKFQRSSSQILARTIWESAVAADPANLEARIGLGLLALVEMDAAGARRQARACVALAESPGAARVRRFADGTPEATPERAFARPDPRGESLLLLAAASYYEGDLISADSAFCQALPRLSPAARAHVEDVTRLLPRELEERLEREHWDSGRKAEFVRRFWASLDPDLGTAANEARLEYLARGALAYFLYFDQRRQRWDERGHTLARYGLPDVSSYNPVLLGSRSLTSNTLVWIYNALGMTVLLEDRTLNEDYDLPISLHAHVDPEPLEEAVALLEAKGEVVVTDRGVFRSRPPHVGRLAGTARSALYRRVAGFDPRAGAAPGTASGRVEVYLGVEETDLGPGFEAEAVVVDSAWREVVRLRQPGVSWCGAEGTPITQFNFDLPAGEYTVGVSAHDPARRRQASWRFPVSVPAVLPGKLEISDIEVACDFLAEPMGGPFDKTRFAVLPSPQHWVSRDRPLGVYFEIYGLLAGEDGRSRHTAEYTVRWNGKDDRSIFAKIFSRRERAPRVQILHSDETPGRSRFQFVTADLESPEPGPYQLEVKITDELSGQVAKKTVDFVVGS
jgi:GWxTD domain-containing protein